MRDLVFMQCAPCDDYYWWQTHLWLESLKSIGKSNKAVSLIFTPNYRDRNPKWDKLKELYPESEFFFYKDTDNITKLLGIYIPLIRPYILMKYFKLHPELKEKAVFYSDCDVLFTEKFNIDKFLNDDVCYLSNTLSYINASYFDSKIKDVIPEKLEQYKTRDILNEACKLVGVSREIAEKNNLNSGGAQYLLKNIDWQFWDKIITDSIKIRQYLQEINKYFFENENKGFQSWCADMWAVLWGLWDRNQETRIVEELNFAWSSDPISKLETCPIFHNAGIVGEKQGEIPVFYKGKYHMGANPFEDSHLELVYNNEQSKTLCNWYYVSKMIELKQKYNL
jgi:hypothetical protein